MFPVPLRRRVQHLVMDESDKLFEMGFVEQIDSILAGCSSAAICRSLFSATLPESVEELAKTVMPDPVRVVIGERWVVYVNSCKFLLSLCVDRAALPALWEPLWKFLQC